MDGSKECRRKISTAEAASFEQCLRLAESWDKLTSEQRYKEITKYIKENRKKGYEYYEIVKMNGKKIFTAPLDTENLHDFVSTQVSVDKNKSVQARMYTKVKRAYINGGTIEKRTAVQELIKKQRFDGAAKHRANDNSLGTPNARFPLHCLGLGNNDKEKWGEDMTFAVQKCEEEIGRAKVKQQSLDQRNEEALEKNEHESTVNAFLSNLDIFEALLNDSVLKMKGSEVMKWLNEKKITHLVSGADSRGIRDAEMRLIGTTRILF